MEARCDEAEAVLDVQSVENLETSPNHEQQPDADEGRVPERYECSCCEELTLREPPPGTYQICRVCNWEDDNMQFDDPDFRGGANVLSLNEARALRQQCVMLRKLESMAASARAAFCHYGMVWIPADGAAIPAEAPGASGNNDAA